MSSTDFQLDEFLDSTEVGRYSSSDLIDGGTNTSSQMAWHEPEYEGKIDYRIRQLSYSSRELLATCERKFQLQRLRSSHRTEDSNKTKVTFAFGHVVGEAIQLAFQGLTEDEIIWKMFLRWEPDLFDSDPKAGKSFFSAVTALHKLLAAREAGFLNDYELVYYQGLPACELSFVINFPDGFRYRGFVDAVLKHKSSGEILVLECKTTGMATVNPATYKNSSQAVGYSIVLDHLFPELSSYQVLYLVYQTKSREYTPIPFQKNYLQRALWIRELLLDIERIKMYEEAGVYPMRGGSCTSWGRDCEYLQTCTLSTEYLTKPCTPEEEDKTEYQISISLVDLLDTQLNKVGT